MRTRPAKCYPAEEVVRLKTGCHSYAQADDRDSLVYLVIPAPRAYPAAPRDPGDRQTRVSPVYRATHEVQSDLPPLCTQEARACRVHRGTRVSRDNRGLPWSRVGRIPQRVPGDQQDRGGIRALLPKWRWANPENAWRTWTSHCSYRWVDCLPQMWRRTTGFVPGWKPRIRHMLHMNLYKGCKYGSTTQYVLQCQMTEGLLAIMCKVS